MASNIVHTISWYKMAQIIKVRTFLNVELSGLHQNIQNFYPLCSGSREIAKNKVTKVIADTLYVLISVHKYYVRMLTVAGH